MKNFKAFLLMIIWTLTAVGILFFIDAHLHYREIIWALGLSLTLLIVHMVNMFIYFSIAGKDPYKWFRD